MKNKVSGSTDGDLVALTWLDLCGIARVRGIPLKHLKGKEEFGLSFPSPGQAMTMFGGIVDNPWGSLGDVRQTPIMSTLRKIHFTKRAWALQLHWTSVAALSGEIRSRGKNSRERFKSAW